MGSLSFDFDPSKLYAPVTFQVVIRLLLSTTDTDAMIVGGDVYSVYLYRTIDRLVYILNPSY